MSSIIESHQNDFNRVIDFLKREISELRTNRASSALVENLIVEAYGVKTPLKQLAAISIPDLRMIQIEPWDKNILKEIEKSFLISDLGLTPIIKDGVIQIVLPALNEERRKELIKNLHQKAENARISLRNIRDKIRDEIVKKMKNREIGEDEKYRFFKELDEKTSQLNEEIKNLVEKKEKEIITV